MSSPSPNNDPITLYGFTAMPANFADGPKPSTSSPRPLPISSLALPTSPLAVRIDALARAHLPPDTYRHSLRVYSYGLAVARECFPQWGMEQGSKLEETWFLTAMLHDAGTPEVVMDSTRLSYEFWAGVFALNVLQHDDEDNANQEGQQQQQHRDAVAPREQAESVCEAIIRHQDVQDKGMVTLMTRLIHLGTLLDNVGVNAHLVARGTMENVVKEYPRTGWSGCFKGTVEREKRTKPWAMVSRIEGFENMIEGNEVMREWD